MPTDADSLFARLMGDEVEPRREFIQGQRIERCQPGHLITNCFT